MYPSGLFTWLFPKDGVRTLRTVMVLSAFIISWVFGKYLVIR